MQQMNAQGIPSEMSDFPENIGKYTILGVAGRGNMGVVYAGHDPFVDRKVAIKLCFADNQGAFPNRIARKLFLNEAQTAGSLDHPNILKVYEAGELNGQPYMVMEYVEGADTLRSYCRADGLLPIENVVDIVIQCAKALDYAHQRGVTHRDIKPANIMLTSDSVVKIVDFGVAQRLHTDRTQILGMFGTPRYMSPEQAKDETITNQSDLYSLGVVMYELLTGRPPFEGQEISNLIYKIITKEPTSVRELRPEVSESLAAVVGRALEKKCETRYQHGQEIVTDLALVLEELQQSQQVLSTALTEEERFHTARALHFFEDFSDAELSEALAEASLERYKRGDTIITEGAFQDGFFVLLSGAVSVTKHHKEICTLQEGECFGEMGFLSDGKRRTSVTAIGPVLALRFDSAIAEWASLPCQIRFSKVFQRTLIERLDRTTERLLQ